MFYRVKKEDEIELGEADGRYIKIKRDYSLWKCNLALQSSENAETSKPVASIALMLLISVPLGIFGVIDVNTIMTLISGLLAKK